MIITEQSECGYQYGLYEGLELGLPPAGAPLVEQEYRIQSGDSLSRIAGRVYGTSNLWRQLYQYNRERGLLGPDPNLIEVGWSMLLPPTASLTGAPQVPAVPMAPAPDPRLPAAATPAPPVPTEEAEQIFGMPRKYVLYGGAAIAIVGAGGIYYMMKKKKKRR